MGKMTDPGELSGATELVPDRRDDLLSAGGNATDGYQLTQDDGLLLRAVGDRGDPDRHCMADALEQDVRRAVHTDVAACRSIVRPGHIHMLEVELELNRLRGQDNFLRAYGFGQIVEIFFPHDPAGPNGNGPVPPKDAPRKGAETPSGRGAYLCQALIHRSC